MIARLNQRIHFFEISNSMTRINSFFIQFSAKRTTTNAYRSPPNRSPIPRFPSTLPSSLPPPVLLPMA